jgi:hypothetical protein
MPEKPQQQDSGFLEAIGIAVLKLSGENGETKSAKEKKKKSEKKKLFISYL